jgi:RNA polymerase sigma-70 factor, ECF subfamily
MDRWQPSAPNWSRAWKDCLSSSGERAISLSEVAPLGKLDPAEKCGRDLATMNEAADSILIEAAIGGDRAAFAELIGRYRAAVWSTVHRTLGNTSEGEDVVQETFLRAFASLPRYDRRYPFGPWILRIATNYCIDQLRRRKARKYRLWSDLTNVEEERILQDLSTLPFDEDLSSNNRDEHLGIAQELLNRLKPRRRMAFVLREIEGHSYEEVASILGVPEVTARVRVWRARADLHKAFMKHISELGKRDGR